ELVPQISSEPSEQTLDAAERRLAGRRLAPGQPFVLDDVVEDVPGIAAPGGGESSVAAWSEHGGLHRERRTVPDSMAARAHEARVLAPERAKAAFDRVGDRDVGFALEVAPAEAAAAPPPLWRGIESGVHRRRENADAEASHPDGSVDDP